MVDGTAIKMSGRALPILIFLLVGCAAAPETIPRRAVFVEEEFAPYAGEGTSTVCGQAFLKTDEGKVKYGSGNAIYLFPDTTYSRESFEVQFVQGRTLSESDPRAQQYMKVVRADVKGKFCFKDLPSGEYYLVSKIVWARPSIPMPAYAGNFERHYIAAQNENRLRGGWAIAHTPVKPGEKVQIIVSR